MKKTLIAVACISILTGCASSLEDSRLRDKTSQRAQELVTKPVEIAAVDRVTEVEGAYIPVVARKISEHAWLRSLKVTVRTGKDPVPMSEVLRSLSRQGVSITSELPLDRFQYTGFSLVDVDAESALRSVVASVGLDYTADAERKLVVIKPMGSKTWYLNIGNRRASFTAGGNTAANPSTTNAVAQSLGQGGANGGTSSTGSSTSTSANSSAGSSSGSTGSGKTQVTTSDDFWTSLKTELEARLKLMLPEPPKSAGTMAGLALPPGLPALPGSSGALPSSLPAMPAQAGSTSDGLLNYSSKQVGSFATNPETGAVTVQAPHWMLQDLDSYFKRTQDMYNASLSFQGELIVLTTDNVRSEGLDISGFAKFANARYGLAFQNNALGGVTVNFPTGGSLVPNLSAGAGALSGPLVGIVSPLDGLQIFNAYLSNLGKVTSLQKPVLTTTSGVPADFSRTVTRYFNTVNQQVASGGTGGAVVGTQNQLVAQDFGTVLRVNPRVDIATGLIRAHIELVQTTQVGKQNVPQSLSNGNSVQQVNNELPIVSRMLYSGEALLKDGDLVVMGGQTDEAESANREGITDLMDSPAVGSLFGKTTKSSNRNIFYFALRVSVNKR